MKKLLKPRFLPVMAAALGGIALVLRRLLYGLAMDARGLLESGHPLETALIVLTGLVLLGIVLKAESLYGSEEYADNFRADKPAAVGHLLAAAGIYLTAVTHQPLMRNYIGQFWQCLGYLAPVCLAAAGYYRFRGQKPFFLLHLIPCLFLVFHIVDHYQQWSGNPQMQDYVFALLGAMTLMFFAFYSAAFEVGMGNRRLHLGMGLAAVYLCLAELAMTEYPFLYLGGAAWALTGLCHPKPRRRRPVKET